MYKVTLWWQRIFVRISCGVFYSLPSEGDVPAGNDSLISLWVDKRITFTGHVEVLNICNYHEFVKSRLGKLLIEARSLCVFTLVVYCEIDFVINL